MKLFKKFIVIVLSCIIGIFVPVMVNADELKDTRPVRTLTLDTRSYMMAPKNVYTVRAKLVGDGLSQNNLKVYSSRTGIAKVERIGSTDLYRITGLSSGVTYVVAEIGGTHASVKVTVQPGVKQHGEACRAVSIISYPDESSNTNTNSATQSQDNTSTRTITLDTRSYTMAPKNVYTLRAKLTGDGLSQNSLKVYSSRTGIAKVERIGSTDLYRITGLSSGVTYVVAEIGNSHASVKVTVQPGVKQHGEACRAVTIIPESAVCSEMRAVWVPFMSLDMKNETDKTFATFQKKFNSIVSSAKNARMNTLIVHVRPFGDAFYPSNYFPWSHLLTGTQGKNPGYDPLAYMIKATHDAGMDFHAWINPLRVQYSGTPPTLSADNPYNKWIHDSTKANWTMSYQGRQFYNPGFAQVRNYISQGVKEIVQKYDVDGIHFDDYFYPSQASSLDSIAYKASETKLSLLEWRKQNINLLVSQVYKDIKSVKTNVVFGISPQGIVENDLAMGADVYTWCSQEGYLDYICPQIYFSMNHPIAPFAPIAKQWRSIVTRKNLKLYLGLGLYKAGTSADSGTWQKSDNIIAQQIQLNRTLNCDGFMLYSSQFLDKTETNLEMQNVKKML